MQAAAKKFSISESSPSARVALANGIDRIFADLPHGRGWATYPFNTLTLGSHYQPIFHAKNGQMFGYEGLLLANNLIGQTIPPEIVFTLSANQNEDLFLDWFCRALHVRNFSNLGSTRADRGMLFINAYPEAAIEDPHHPDVFKSILDYYSINARDVVIEILETGVSDDAKLADAVALYRKLGCRIAIDDFGIGFSNFERLWRLRPDFVKIDRSVLVSATKEAQARLVLANMVRLIKSCGAEVIIEGIEDRAQASLALELGADYLQGYYFARPSSAPFPHELGLQMVQQLHDAPHESLSLPSPQLQSHIDSLVRAAKGIAHGKSLSDACAIFLAEPNAIRAYLIDGNLQQAMTRIEITGDQAWLNLPTPDTSIWCMRNSLERALAAPNTIQVISPLRVEVIPPAPTITFSYAFLHGDHYHVLCGDVLATETISANGWRPSQYVASPETTHDDCALMAAD